MHSNNAISLLWDERKSTSANEARTKLIVHYTPLVKLIAGDVSKRLPQNIELSDLISYGMFGLIDAINKFEPELGWKFKTYAKFRIKGAIIDELRSIDWVPRSIRDSARKVDKARSVLEAKLCRSPRQFEIAEYMGINQEELREILDQISYVGVLSLDKVMSGVEQDNEEATIGDKIIGSEGDPVASFELKEMKHILADIIKKMPERECKILTLYYYENLTLLEISKILNITEAYVSIIHSKAIVKIKAQLTEHDRYVD